MPTSPFHRRHGLRLARHVGPAAGAGLLLGLLAGCSAFDAMLNRGKPGPHAISVHRLADPAVLPPGMVQIVVDAAGRERVCINNSPIISNRNIERGQIVPTQDPERPTLRLFLDPHGSIRWYQVCQEVPGDTVVVLLDGFLWHRFTLPRPIDTRSVLLQEGIGRTEAEAIVKSIPKQYRRLNPSSGLF